MREIARWNVNKKIRCLVRNKIKHLQSFSNSASLVRERLKSCPRVSEISLSCTPPGVRFYVSHFWDGPVPIFSDVRFSYLALVQHKKNHVHFTGKCMLYSLCQLPPEFSMLFLFKINNSLYISFQSFINSQILTIGHIILFQSMFCLLWVNNRVLSLVSN